MFDLEKKEKFVIIHANKDKEILDPEILKTMNPPDPVDEKFAHLGVIISGKIPLWLCGFLVHFYHPTSWVAIYVPSIECALVIQSHNITVQVGDRIPI